MSQDNSIQAWALKFRDGSMSLKFLFRDKEKALECGKRWNSEDPPVCVVEVVVKEVCV